MIGNIPGLNMGNFGTAGMMPVQMGMPGQPQGSQPGQKKEGGKDGKDDPSGTLDLTQQTEVGFR